MLVVADSSPFIGLLNIGHVDVLPKLYGAIVIPAAVAAELSHSNRPAVVQSFMASLPPWLSERGVKQIEPLPQLDAGEREAISLARELHADLLLIDEKAGRDAAMARNIQTLRTTALLLVAANAGVLPDLRTAFTRLKATNFRVTAQILDRLLVEHEAFKRRGSTP